MNSVKSDIVRHMVWQKIRGKVSHEIEDSTGNKIRNQVRHIIWNEVLFEVRNELDKPLKGWTI